MFFFYLFERRSLTKSVVVVFFVTFDFSEIDCLQSKFRKLKNLPNIGIKYLLIFDDFCKEISNSKQFLKIITTGRNMGLNTIYTNYKVYHQNKLERDVELQNTHIIFRDLSEFKQ